MEQNTPELPSRPQRTKWYVTVWGVIILLATIGPFGLPFLWKSKDITLFWKWVTTIALILLTIFFTWLTWVTIVHFIDQLRAYGIIP